MKTIDEAFSELQSAFELSVFGRKNGAGFATVDCPMCGAKNKGGLKLEHDKIGYNCFKAKCDSSFVYTKGEFIPNKLKAMADIMGVKIPVELAAAALKRRNALFEESSDKVEKNFYTPLEIPPHFVELNYFNNPLGVEHLRARQVLSSYYDCFMHVESGKFKDCIAVIHRLNGAVIGWDYVKPDYKDVSKTSFYVTDPASNQNLIFVPSGKIERVMFGVEGIFDALCFPNTVAFKKYRVDKKQAFHLIGSRVIVIPDTRSGDLYESAKAQEWEVSLPLWGESDLCDAVNRYGLLITAQKVHDSINTIGNMSELLYRRWNKGG